jgi:hypothetical protein
MIDPRKFLTFLHSKTGQMAAFGAVFFIACCLLTGFLYLRCSPAQSHARIQNR